MNRYEVKFLCSYVLKGGGERGRQNNTVRETNKIIQALLVEGKLKKKGERKGNKWL